MREAEESARKFAEKFKDAIRETLAEVAVLVIGVDSVKGALEKTFEGVKGVFDLSRDLRNLSNQTGASVRDLVQLRAEFDLSGVAADHVGAILNRMQRSIEGAADKGGMAAEMFYQLGLNIYDLQQMNPAAQFDLLRQRLTAIEDPARRAQLAMKIFGNFGGGGNVLAIFGNAKIAQEASEAISKQADILARNANTFQEVSINMELAGVRIEGFFVGMAAPIGNVILPLLKEINSVDLTKWGSKIGDSIAGAVRELYNMTVEGGLGDALDTMFQGIITGFGNGMKDALIGAAEAFGAQLLESMATPISTLQAMIAYSMRALGTKDNMDGYLKTEQKARAEAEIHYQKAMTFSNSGDQAGFAREQGMFEGYKKIGDEAAKQYKELFDNNFMSPSDWMARYESENGPSLFGKSSQDLKDSAANHLMSAGSEFGSPIADALAALNTKYGKRIPGEGTPNDPASTNKPFTPDMGFGQGSKNITGIHAGEGGWQGVNAWSAGPVDIEGGMAGRAGRIVSQPHTVEQNTADMKASLSSIDKQISSLTEVA